METVLGMISRWLVRPTYQHSVSGPEVRPVAALLGAVSHMGLMISTSPSQDEFHSLVPGL